MAIAIAIVLAMVLYLLDKHGMLKQVLTKGLKVFALAGLVGGVIIGTTWTYRHWRDAQVPKQSSTESHPKWQPVSESPAPNSQKVYTVSYAELGRTKLFRGLSVEGQIDLLRHMDSFFASVNDSSQRIIVKRLLDEGKPDPEFDLPDNALCAFSEAFFKNFGGSLVSPCGYTAAGASCPTAVTSAPPNGYVLVDDAKPCFTVRVKRKD